MKIWSYMIYIICYETLTLGGTAYVVFAMGNSGWWFLLGILVSSGCFKPERWSSLWDEKIAEKYRAKEEKTVT